MEAPLLVAWLDLGTDHGLEFSTALRCWARHGGIFSLQISTRMVARGKKMSLLLLAPTAMGKGPIWAR